MKGNMETKLEFLKRVYGLVKNPNPDSLKLSLSDTHQKGIFSLVIGGSEFGKLTRVFMSEIKLKPFEVQLHTHRYPIKLTMIKGDIKHYEAVRDESSKLTISEFEYKSPLNGGSGLRYLQETKISIKDYSLPIGSTIEMDETEFHTMSCSKGSIWIVEEQGFKTDSSRVLGVPFITDGLYNEPKMFQINDKCQVLAKELKKIILDYELID